jgi:hypothetical protein
MRCRRLSESTITLLAYHIRYLSLVTLVLATRLSE